MVKLRWGTAAVDVREVTLGKAWQKGAHLALPQGGKWARRALQALRVGNMYDGQNIREPIFREKAWGGEGDPQGGQRIIPQPEMRESSSDAQPSRNYDCPEEKSKSEAPLSMSNMKKIDVWTVQVKLDLTKKCLKRAAIDLLTLIVSAIIKWLGVCHRHKQKKSKFFFNLTLALVKGTHDLEFVIFANFAIFEDKLLTCRNDTTHVAMVKVLDAKIKECRLFMKLIPILTSKF